MPTYVYKAMTKNGQIVKNKITETNKVSCAQRLKRNDLIPISITQTIREGEPKQRKPKNLNKTISDEELKRIGTQRIKEQSNRVNRKQIDVKRKNS